MMQFCIAYCGILSKHTVCATNTTGKLEAEDTGLPVASSSPMSTAAASRLAPGSPITRLIWFSLFSDPQSSRLDADLSYITRLVDQYNIPTPPTWGTAGDADSRSWAGRFGLA